MSCIQEKHLSVSGKEILLEIAELNPDNILITITNLNYDKEKFACVKHLILLGALYASYKAFIFQKCFIDVCLLFAFAYFVYKLFHIVKFESLTFINEFGMQIGSKCFLCPKGSTFIPTSDIHDVVINEVVCDLKVLYVLIIRTKGNLFKTKPIIPLFDNLRPNVNCLESIYKVLYKKFK